MLQGLDKEYKIYVERFEPSKGMGPVVSGYEFVEGERVKSIGLEKDLWGQQWRSRVASKRAREVTQAERLEPEEQI